MDFGRSFSSLATDIIYDLFFKPKKEDVPGNDTLDVNSNLTSHKDENNDGPLFINIEIADDVENEGIHCNICLEIYKVGEKAYLLICDHFFHIRCYEKWKDVCKANGYIVTCPLCRSG